MRTRRPDERGLWEYPFGRRDELVVIAITKVSHSPAS
jgi:hypothetical protein